MKTRLSRTRVVIFSILVLFFAFGAQSPVGKAVACEIEEQGWEVPALEGLKTELVGDQEADGKIYENEAAQPPPIRIIGIDGSPIGVIEPKSLLVRLFDSFGFPGSITVDSRPQGTAREKYPALKFCAISSSFSARL
jgi:hypothetical protein